MRFSVSNLAVMAVVAAVGIKAGGLDALTALAAGEEEDQIVQTVADGEAEGAEGTVSADLPVETAPEVIPEFLVDIAIERAALEEKRAALAAKEADLALVEDAVVRQMGELGALRDELSRLLETANMNHDADLGRLVNMYVAMKPSQAGQIIGTMDLEVATLVIASMQERQSGPILANMDVRRAQTISKIIYERSKLPGDQREVMLPVGG